jgi:hypothetical protein
VTKAGIVRISDPAMEWHEIDLNELIACARRELAFRQWVYPKRVAEGKMKEGKAEHELAMQRQIVDFLVHCLFKAVSKNKGI